MTDKILNLSDVEEQDFIAIQDAIDEWKDSGLEGMFTFITEDEFSNNPNYLRDAYFKAIGNSKADWAVKGMVGLALGVGGTLLVNKLIKAEKNKAVVQEVEES